MGGATNLSRRISVLREQEQHNGGGGSGETSSISSTDSNYNHNQISSSNSLSTDLRLGLSISSSDPDHFSCSTSSTSSRQNHSEWTTTIPSLFVKVYKEGIPIGRKLDLMSHDGYHSLVPTLTHMFNISILCPSVNQKHISERDHILTYEDKEGDWMLVGDVPWEMFLSSVKKLKISKADAW